MRNIIIELNSIEQLADTFGLSAPTHPLIALYTQREMSFKIPAGQSVRMGLYAIILKDEQDCKMQIWLEGLRLFKRCNELYGSWTSGDIFQGLAQGGLYE